jgi:hypothetical protein
MFHDPQLLLLFGVTKKLEDLPLSAVRDLFLYTGICPACVVFAVAVSDIAHVKVEGIIFGHRR